MVDEEEMIRFLIRKEIESLNLDINVVGEAVDGHEGILLFRELRPSIIITDVRMPRIDGLKMINLIKKESPEVVVIILSAYAEFSYAQKAINEGALDYLLKPIDEDSLYRCLSSAINKSKEQQRSKTKLFKMEKE